MRIAVVSDSDRRGGAAIAAARLSEGFAREGAEAHRFVVFRDGNDARTAECSVPRPRDQIIVNLLSQWVGEQVSGQWLIRSREDRIVSAVRAYAPQIVHVHNLHGASLTLRLLEGLCATGIPVVWTLHDMWAFTGGCAYAYECDAFSRVACDHTCPNPDTYPPLDRARIHETILACKRFFEGLGSNIVIVTPSNWLANEARRSVLAANRIEVIANGVDTALFSPVPRSACRDVLGLPGTKRIILTGGTGLRDPRKGWTFLRSALAQLSPVHDLHLLTFGRDQVLDAAIPTTYLGNVEDDRLLCFCYGAADVFALPTLADNLPSVLLEALACERPSVAFGVGGVPEVIRDGETGFLARSRDASHFAERLHTALSLTDAARTTMEQECRRVAIEEFDLGTQAQRYLELFASLSGGNV